MHGKLKIWRESASLILAAKAVFSAPNPFNYKVLCLKRSSKSDAFPSNFVFPGGNLSKSDSSPDWLAFYEKLGFSRESFADLAPQENVPKILQSEGNSIEKHLSFRICAIRETFEECGILLCKSAKVSGGSTWASSFGSHELINWQHKVHDDSTEFLNLCRHFDVYPDVWALKNWCNWITPPSAPATFNTMFFLASFHQMPTVQKDEREIQDLMWTTPEEYIKMNNELNVVLPSPQFYELSRLKTVKNIDVLAKFAAGRSKFGCESYWPYRVNTEDGCYTILPGDDLYPAQIDKTNNEIPFVGELPESRVKNRILHKKEISNDLIVENFTPKCNHIIPKKK